jgi:hypothetical protein
VPLAVVARGVRGSAYLATLGAFVAFYVLSRLSVALAENGVHAFVAGFMPDAAVLGAGLLCSAVLVSRGVGKPT